MHTSANEAAAASALLAVGMYTKALKLAQETDDALTTMICNRQLAVLAYVQDKPDEALVLLHKHLALATSPHMRSVCLECGQVSEALLSVESCVLGLF